MTRSNLIIGGGLIVAASLFALQNSEDSRENGLAVAPNGKSGRIIDPSTQNQNSSQDRAKAQTKSPGALDIRVMSRKELEEEVRLRREEVHQLREEATQVQPPEQERNSLSQTNDSPSSEPLSEEEREAISIEAARRGLDQEKLGNLLANQNPSTVRAMLKQASSEGSAPNQDLPSASQGGSSSAPESASGTILNSETTGNVYEQTREKLASDPQLQDPAAIENAKAERFQAYLDAVHAEEERQRNLHQ